MNILDYVQITISTVNDGNMSLLYGDKEEVTKNKINFFKNLNLEINHTYQIGSNPEIFNIVKYVDQIPTELTWCNGCDAIITKNKDIVLALLTADCLTVTLYDPIQKVLALVHCGMKWENAGILDRVVQKMEEEFKCKPSDMLVHLGNCIGKENYKWDSNIFNVINKDSFIFPNILKDEKYNSEKCYQIDLRQSVIDHLNGFGIFKNNILDSGIDCYTDLNYFSHARSINTGEVEGRHITLVKML
jgi:copper oxidase (laccase) domain-containing protein